MTTIKCEQCSRTEHLEDIDERLPGTWRELCTLDGGTVEMITVGCHGAAATAGRYNVSVRIPRRLYFCTVRHEVEWLQTAIENHVEHCAKEDAEYPQSAASYERRMRS